MGWEELEVLADDYERTARVFLCSDGVTRIVHTPRYYWRVFDWLQSKWGYDMEAAVRCCWEEVVGQENAEYLFGTWVEQAIHAFLDLCRQENEGLANDNFKHDFFAPEAREH